MVLSEDVQRAAFEGDLETITAWMASNDVNDTVVATPHRFNANSRSTLLKLIVKRATNAGASQVSVLPLARAVIARGADLDRCSRCRTGPFASSSRTGAFYLLGSSRHVVFEEQRTKIAKLKQLRLTHST